MTNSRLNRIGIFIDGTYFGLIGQYYQNDNPLKRHLDQKSFLEFTQTKVASTLQLKFRNTRVDICNMYIGLPSTQAVEKTYWQEQSLAEAGIKLNVFPLKKLPDSTFKEQGVDATLAFEIGLAVKNLDTVVIITGDGDFIGTMNRVKGLKKKTFLFYWNIIKNKNETIQKEIFTNSELVRSVDYPINMGYEIKKGLASKDEMVERIFGLKQTRTAPTEEKQLGVIVSLGHTGGFIRPLLGGRLIQFLSSDMNNTSFNKFQKSQTVKFVTENRCANEKKEPLLVATNVTLQE